MSSNIDPLLNGKPHITADDLYYPHINQRKILADTHRYRVLIAGRRFGKSALAINYALAWILDSTVKDQVVWIILPEYKQAKSIYWDDPNISNFFLPYVNAGELKKNDSELSLYCARTNSRIVLKGSDKPDSLRGSGLDLIIWDEVADIKPEAFDVVSPALTDSPNHKVLLMGTPDGYNHFHDFALMGDHAGIIERAGKEITANPDYITFKFTSYDNMTWAEGTPERISFVNNLNAERRKYKEQGQEDWFEQEYLAEFRKRAGAVHKLFDRAIHLLPWMQLPNEFKRQRGWDFGSSHPTASVRVATDPDDNWFVEISYKKSGLTIEKHAENVKLQDVDYLTPQGDDPIPGFGDPSGAQWIKEFNAKGFSITAAKRSSGTEKISWLELAIDKINEKLAPKEGHTVMLPDGTRMDNAPSMFILIRAENMDLVDEFETLAYKKTAEGLQKTELDDTADMKGHYDLHACMRYFAVSLAAPISYGYANQSAIKNYILKKAEPDLSDEETRKKLELQADLAIIAEQNRRIGMN